MSLNERLGKSGTGISYAEPKEGGRVRPDGVKLKWRVTFPHGVDRGNVNFWCEDVTPRDRRVPATEENTTHPSGVKGMAGMIQEVKKDRLKKLSDATAAILDLPATEGNDYGIEVPNEVEKLKKPFISLQEPSKESQKDLALTLVLQTGTDDKRDDIQERIGDGVVSIRFA